MLTAPKKNLGIGIEMLKLLFHKSIVAVYPLHEPYRKEKLLELCVNFYQLPINGMPIEPLRDYFGEKIALYWEFIRHYSTWLLFPSFVGFVFQLIIWITSNYSHPVAASYAILITIWSVLMLRYWKRQESRIGLKWGVLDFQKDQRDRPEFTGILLLNSFLDGKEMIYFPKTDLQKRIFLSITSIFVFILLVIGVIAAIYVLRFSLVSQIGEISSVITSFLNGLQITLFNFIYLGIAVQLTNRENHRTDVQYEDALIIKVFVFQFINSYASFFYLAYIAQYLMNPNQHAAGFLVLIFYFILF
jgi:hypothetical protein